jgi:hypothetical protein
MHLKNGKQQGLCFGSMGNVSLPNYRRASWIDDDLILQRARVKAHYCMYYLGIQLIDC